MSTSSSRPLPLPKLNAFLTALAACASLAGSALLLPAPAGAEVSNGPSCGGQFWTNLWCLHADDDQGGGSGDGESDDVEVRKIHTDGRDEAIVVEDPSNKPKANVGGRPQGAPPRDLDAERGGRGERGGGSGLAAGQRVKCRIPGQRPVLLSKGECESRRRLARETPEQRERREAACQILDVVIGSLEEQKKLDVQFDQMQESVFGPIGLTTEEKRRRAGQERRLKRYDRAWLKADCVQFVPPAEDAKG